MLSLGITEVCHCDHMPCGMVAQWPKFRVGSGFKCQLHLFLTVRSEQVTLCALTSPSLPPGHQVLPKELMRAMYSLGSTDGVQTHERLPDGMRHFQKLGTHLWQLNHILIYIY